MKKSFLLFLLMCYSVMAQTTKTKVACVGDSVTFGMLLENREQTCYPAQLQKMLGDTYEVGNFGKNGATLLSKGHRPYIEQEEYKNAIAFAGDLVIIHLGLNDTDPRNWPNHKEHFFQNYLDLIGDFRKANPNAKIWICRMTPITHKHARFPSGTRDWYWQIQQEIEKIASYANVGLIDLQEVLYHRPDLLPDALHPSAEGAHLIAKRVFGALTGNFGGFSLPEIYSDNMVLQRNKTIDLQGVANANDEVSVKLLQTTQHGKAVQTIQEKSVKTDASGKWVLALKPVSAGEGFELSFSVNGKVVKRLKNVAFGEVFLCSGQSNMAFPLHNEAEFNKEKEYSLKNVRIFDMKPRREVVATEWDLPVLDSINRLNYYKSTNWKEMSSANAKKFSAVAYHFANKLSEELKVPVGLIHNAIGGSNLESWVDRKTLEHEFHEILKDWKKNDFIQDWVRERGSQNIKKSTHTEQRHPFEPAYLYEAGILPLKNYNIAGVLWYQGESNAHNIETFERLFPLFVGSWRKYFNNEKLPFYVVQLSAINRPSWGWFRDAQRKLSEKIPQVFMAVSSDRGHQTDVHPTRKREVGERLAFQALHHQFGKKKIVPSGPMFKKVSFEKGTAFVEFDFAQGMKGENNQPIKGFEIAETDGLFFPAQVEVKGKKLRVWSEKVANPKYIRYSFAPFNDANLVNEANLPASTFRN